MVKSLYYVLAFVLFIVSLFVARSLTNQLKPHLGKSVTQAVSVNLLSQPYLPHQLKLSYH